MLNLRRTRLRQQGVALLLMLLALLIFVGTFIIYSSDDGEEMRISERERTARALAAAKEALLAHAAIDWLDLGPPPPATPRPGELPCPDTDNDGDSEGAACQNIGWLPWKTLELDDLRDASGERLWYAVSEDFQDDGSAEPVINPGNIGQFNLEMGQAVAVIMAPGPSLGGQNRSSIEIDTNVAVIQNYLEGENAEAGGSFDNLFTNVNVPGNSIFDGAINDQIVTITVDEIMERVAHLAMGEIAAALRLFYTNKGYYPYSELDENASCDAGTDTSRRNIGFPVISITAPPPPPPPGGCPYDKSLSDYGLPAWINTFGWHKYVFSVVAEACVAGTVNCGGPGGFLSLDNVGGIRAMTVYVGKTLQNTDCAAGPGHNQIRVNAPTAGWDDLCNFLETVENTNGDDDLVYVRPGPAVNSNDKFMIVAQ